MSDRIPLSRYRRGGNGGSLQTEERRRLVCGALLGDDRLGYKKKEHGVFDLQNPIDAGAPPKGA